MKLGWKKNNKLNWPEIILDITLIATLVVGLATFILK